MNRFIVGALRRERDSSNVAASAAWSDMRSPRVRVVDACVDDVEPARVDAVEPEHRQHRRKRPRRAALHLLEHLDDAELRRRARGSPLLRQSLKSPAMISGASLRDRGPDAVDSAAICHCRPRSNNPRCTLRQCSTGMRAPSSISQCRTPRLSNRCAEMSLVLLPDDREARQHRIAVVAVAIDGVLAVRDLAPAWRPR